LGKKVVESATRLEGGPTGLNHDSIEEGGGEKNFYM
jgi:hypothetical protein